MGLSGGEQPWVTSADIHAARPECLSIVQRRDHDGELRMWVVGEVDIDSAAQLDEALRRALARRPIRGLTIDFAGVPFLDAAGIRVLAHGRALADLHNVALRVVKIHRNVVRVLEITGVLDLLTELD